MTRTSGLAGAVALTLAATLLAAAPATAEPDGTTSTTSAAAAAVADDGQVVIGGFEDPAEQWDVNVSGTASGELALAAEEPSAGSSHARLTASVPTGTLELARWPGRIEAEAIVFSVRSTDVDIITVRLQDSTGQAHQQRITLDPSVTGWQEVRITDFTSGANYLHFGGADDGVWHGPLGAFSIILDTWSFTDGASSGTLDVDGVVAEVATAPVRVETLALGNTFHPGEPVEVGLVGDVDEVSWTVRDGFGTVVEVGDASGADLAGRLPLAIDDPGWYGVDIVATVDGVPYLTGTDVAVLTELPADFVRDQRLSVSTHFAWEEWPLEAATLVGEAGFGMARDEAYWYNQETTAGEFVWQDRVLAYQQRFDELGLGNYHILSYGNPLYFEDEAPTTPEGREAFARYAVESVRQFGVDGNVFEVWNEWNWRDLDGAAGGSAEQYVELLKVVHAAVTAEFPDAVLVGPALAPMNDWSAWFTEFADRGGLDYIDAVSTHPYTFPNEPENSTRFEGQWEELRRIMAEHGHGDMPIHISETGWHTSETSVGVDEATQAQHLLRGRLVALADGVESVTIYDFMDDGTDPAEAEHRFGIVRNPDDTRGALVPKPAYVSSAVMNRQLAGMPFDRQVDLGDGVYDSVFSDGDRTVHTAWARTPTVVAATAGGPVEVTDMFGGTTTLTPGADGRVHVSLDGSPVYLEGAITDVEPSTTFALSVEPETAGTPAGGAVAVDNTGGAALDLTVEPIGGDAVTAQISAGASASVEVTYDAQASLAERTYTALVRDGEAAVALLRTTGSPTPALSVTGVHGVTDDGQTLRLQVTNAAAQPLTLEGVSVTVGTEASTVGAGEAVPAQGSILLELPIEVTMQTSWEAVATVTDGPTASGAGVLVPLGDLVTVPAGSVTLDGVVDEEVRALEPHVVGAEAPAIPDWEGPEDLQASIWMTHDDEGLTLVVEATDDIHSQSASGGDIWQGDGVQIGIVAGGPGENVVPQELGVALTDTGEVVVHRWAPAEQSGTPEGVDAVVVRDEEAATTTYEVTFGWSSLGIDPEGRLLASTVVLNENDGAGRSGWLTWGAGLAEAKNPALFQALVLEPAATEPEAEAEITLRTSVRSQCWGDQAVVAVHVVNTGDLGTDVRFSTAWGEKKFTGITADGAGYHGFQTGVGSIEAGTVTAAAYSWNDGDPVYQRLTLPYDSVTCG